MSEHLPFKGSFVSIWAKELAQGAMLMNARVHTLGGRSFIVGEVPDDGTKDIRTGLTYWFAVDDVLMITEFRDLEQARAYFAEREKKTRNE